ncbi:DNA methyltransferase [Candidatus Magnetomonas plexicatena]|uniref:DNA methyltransferase n=1 Tax=Candidatus Magnetomonas plexicatena TaxID=2552947 RepID=UPI0040330451
MNTLYYGDNLDILRNHIADDSVDLIYLDPPFNSKADYNILYKEPTGRRSEAQITAFEDTWHWTEESERAFHEIINTAPAAVVEMIRAFRQFIGVNDMMAYLTMMCIRLIELKRVLKDTGSIYLHCDPTASHYLKILMDAVFGKKNFRNEIVWKRTSGHSDAKRFGNIHDIVLFYSKSEHRKWRQIYHKYDKFYEQQYYRYTDPDGRKWMSDNLGASGLLGGGLMNGRE